MLSFDGLSKLIPTYFHFNGHTLGAHSASLI
jgi:hypothetical protein